MQRSDVRYFHKYPLSTFRKFQSKNSFKIQQKEKKEKKNEEGEEEKKIYFKSEADDDRTGIDTRSRLKVSVQLWDSVLIKAVFYFENFHTISSLGGRRCYTMWWEDNISSFYAPTSQRDKNCQILVARSNKTSPFQQRHGNAANREQHLRKEDYRNVLSSSIHWSLKAFFFFMERFECINSYMRGYLNIAYKINGCCNACRQPESWRRNENK